MPATKLFNGVTSAVTSDSVDTSGYTGALVQVWSASGSVAQVVIEQKTDIPGSPWTASGVITNPSATGEAWTVPPAGPTRLRISAYTSGAISGGIVTLGRRV